MAFMKHKNTRFLLTLFLLTGTTYFVFRGVALAKGVLAPFFLAIILAMMLAPVSRFLEQKGLKRGWASFFSDLILLFLILGILGAVGHEVQRVANQWGSIQSRLSSQLDKVESFIEENSGFSIENPFLQDSGKEKDQDGQQNPQQEAQDGQPAAQRVLDLGDLPVRSWLTTSLSKIFNFLATILLILVYIFFMLLYREKFRNAVLTFVPEGQKDKGNRILSEITKDAQQYLFGRMIVILVDASLYAVGFSFSGMESPVSTAFLAAALTIVPYIGNFVGGAIAIALGFITTGKPDTVWIVLATMTITQFVESYFISPYLVGKRIKVNPLFTIFTVVIGAAVWGVIGMIVFLPLFSFIKAVADHVPMLHPLGYTIGTEDASEGEDIGSRLANKVRSWFHS